VEAAAGPKSSLDGPAGSRRPNDPVRDDTATRDAFTLAFSEAPELFSTVERGAMNAIYFQGLMARPEAA
jgi:hypothetical protein